MSKFEVMNDFENYINNKNTHNVHQEYNRQTDENKIVHEKSNISFLDYKYITGCITISYFDILDKKILLLGDLHHVENKYENNNHMISVTEYFKKYLSMNTNIIDFFVEIEDDLHNVDRENISEMYTFINDIYINCLEQKKCIARFHHIDIRKKFNKFVKKDFDSYALEIPKIDIKQRVLVIFNWIQTLYNKMLIYVNNIDNDIYNDMVDELIRLYNHVKVEISRLGEDLESYFVYTVFEITKIKKQIENIESQKIRQILEDKYKKLLYEHRLCDLADRQIEKIEKIKKLDVDLGEKLLLIFEESHHLSKPFSIINDIYTIARIFRNFKNNITVNTAVVFAGLEHINTMFEILSIISKEYNTDIISKRSNDFKISTEGFDIIKI